jgi:hypothetical protein
MLKPLKLTGIKQQSPTLTGQVLFILKLKTTCITNPDTQPDSGGVQAQFADSGGAAFLGVTPW